MFGKKIVAKFNVKLLCTENVKFFGDCDGDEGLGVAQPKPQIFIRCFSEIKWIEVALIFFTEGPVTKELFLEKVGDS